MKIGKKIAFFYTIVTMCALTLVMIVFYLFTSRYINKLYDSYLAEKTYLTAQKYWEKDEVDELSYNTIQQKYNNLLPQAHEILLNVDSTFAVRDTLSKYLNKSQQLRLFNEGVPLTFTYKGQMGAALYYPDNEGNFVVLVMSHNTYGMEIQEHILMLSVFLLLFSAILIFFIGQVYSGRILLPLQHILKELKRIRGNNLGRRMKTFGNKDELDELIQTLNEMLDRIDAAFKSEKSFISNASHELNNPLTAIQGECEISLMKERSVSEYMESLHRISAESRRISQLIKHLLFLSRQDEDLLQNSVERIDLKHLLDEISRDDARLKFYNEEDNNCWVDANPYLLRIALQNIIDNACKYSEKDVDIRLVNHKKKPTIEVMDYGIGVPADEIQHIFQSFYRAANTRGYSGQGVGLSLSMKILAIYGGKIAIESEVGSYTKVIIAFS